MARRVISVALAMTALAVAAVVLLGGDPQHRLRASFASAVQMKAGQQVRLGGRTVGSISSVKLVRGRALITMSVGDEGWPLPRGTSAQLRFGAPAAYAARYVELHPGRTGAGRLPDDALLPARDAVSAVEFDELLGTFDARARADLGGLLDHAGATLDGRGDTLGRALDAAGPAFEQAAGVQRDLGIDSHALSTLVTAGAATADALRRREPALTGTVSHGAATFRVFADNAAALRLALHRLPGTLTTARGTLARLDRSLPGLDALVKDLRPGAAGLRRTAPLLRRTLIHLDRIAPLATTTLRQGARSAPGLAAYLKAIDARVPALRSILGKAEPMLACLRPYGPEVAGLLSTWASFTGYYDSVGGFGRALLVQSPAFPGTPLTAKQNVDLSGGALTYAFPRPPGLNAGKPWFQPQCGAGRDGLNPAKDPEVKR